MATFFAILPVLLSLLPLVLSAAPRDTLVLGSSLSVNKHQTDVLRSPDGTFSCGFSSIYDNAFTFSIWYTNSANKTVVWTANRGRPVHARGAAVTLRKGGTLVLTDYDGAVVWQAEGGDSAGVQYAQLLDTGNLVMKNSSGTVVWQSFDSPTDTLLPTQRITAATELVSSTGMHVPGHYIFHFTDSSILSLIYDDADFHEIYWPDPDNGEYQNNRNRYNSTRFGVLDDTGNFFSSDFANQQGLVTSNLGDIPTNWSSLQGGWLADKLKIPSKINFFLIAGILWAMWTNRNKMAIEKIFPNNPLCVIRSGVAFIQRWKSLLKPADQERIKKILEKAQAWIGGYSSNAACISDIGEI